MASSKRERELHRQKLARQQAEMAAAAERRKRNLLIAGVSIAVIAVIAIVAGLAIASDDDDTTESAATSDACVEVNGKQPNGKQFDEVEKKLKAKAVYTSAVETTCGDMTFTLDAKNAPTTTAAFAFLSGQHFFDNTTCHRLTTANLYVLQCGDPEGTGKGGPGFAIDEENLPKADKTGVAVYPRGTIAMANAGKGTTGSQFFLVYKDSPLPADYTVLGKVTKGLDVVETVAAAGTADGSADGPPAQPLQITSLVTSADDSADK